MENKATQPGSKFANRSKSVPPLTDNAEPRTFVYEAELIFKSTFDDLRWLPAPNGDMNPIIQAGDALLVDPTVRSVEHKKVYLLNRDGELQMRRLFTESDGRVRVSKDIDDIGSGEVVSADAIDIVARVVLRESSAA